MSPQAWIMLFCLGLIWGGTFSFTEILLETMTPFHIVFFRVTIAAMAMHVYLRLRGKAMPLNSTALKQFMIMGLFNNALPFSLIVFGQQYITAGLASILNSSTAFVTVILAGIILSDERITAPRVIGTALGVFGVAVTMGVEHLSNLSLTSIGQFLIILAAFSYAIASMYGKLRVKNQDVEISATGMLTAAAFWMLILSFVFEGTPVMTLEPAPIMAMLAFAIPCTCIAYMLYFAILKRAGAGNTMLVTIIIPVFALIIDATLLEETIKSREVIGFGIIAFGLLILSGKLSFRKA